MACRYGGVVAPQEVVVVEYDALWPRIFAAERSGLLVALAPWLAGDLHHIGSTAVPALAAKPIIDMMAGVTRLDHARAALEPLAALGYESGSHRPSEALWFYKPGSDDLRERRFQLHLTEVGTALWNERLSFRDALRGDAQLRDEYAELKLALAASSDDVRSYTDAKRAFVGRVLATAGIELPLA
jgi:GrpB-like predicted nucleotidyltransferase (UPF0157 family)